MIKKAYIDLPDGQIHYRHLPAASGLPVVFLHRTPTSSSSFERVMTHLAGWRPLIALDTPGFGGSFDPQGQPTIETFCGWILAALDRLGVTKFHLCGHHTGTHFAIELGATRPERVRSLLLDGVMFSDASERAAMLTGLEAAGSSLDEDGAYLTKSWNFMKPYYPGADAALLHVEIIGALRSLTSRGPCARAIFSQDVPAVLPRVRCPMLIAIAEDDALFPHLARIRKALPHLDTRITAPAGVASPELDSVGFAKRLRSLVDSCKE